MHTKTAIIAFVFICTSFILIPVFRSSLDGQDLANEDRPEIPSEAAKKSDMDGRDGDNVEFQSHIVASTNAGIPMGSDEQSSRDTPDSSPPVVTDEAGSSSEPSSLEDVLAWFDSETKDSLWSEATESRVLNQISQIEGVSITSMAVECRTTICRAEFVHPAGTDYRPTLDPFELIGKPNPPVPFEALHAIEGLTLWFQILSPGHDGIPTTHIYYQREGVSLPAELQFRQ